jgi:hypothetical protein
MSMIKDIGSVIQCDKCNGVLFTLKWIMEEAPKPSGLYRSCAECGQIKAIIEGYQSQGVNL